jgi:hypothetical protein
VSSDARPAGPSRKRGGRVSSPGSARVEARRPATRCPADPPTQPPAPRPAGTSSPRRPRTAIAAPSGPRRRAPADRDGLGSPGSTPAFVRPSGRRRPTPALPRTGDADPRPAPRPRGGSRPALQMPTSRSLEEQLAGRSGAVRGSAVGRRSSSGPGDCRLAPRRPGFGIGRAAPAAIDNSGGSGARQRDLGVPRPGARLARPARGATAGGCRTRRRAREPVPGPVSAGVGWTGEEPGGAPVGGVRERTARYARILRLDRPRSDAAAAPPTRRRSPTPPPGPAHEPAHATATERRPTRPPAPPSTATRPADRSRPTPGEPAARLASAPTRRDPSVQGAVRPIGHARPPERGRPRPLPGRPHRRPTAPVVVGGSAAGRPGRRSRRIGSRSRRDRRSGTSETGSREVLLPPAAEAPGVSPAGDESAGRRRGAACSAPRGGYNDEPGRRPSPRPSGWSAPTSRAAWARRRSDRRGPPRRPWAGQPRRAWAGDAGGPSWTGGRLGRAAEDPRVPAGGRARAPGESRRAARCRRGGTGLPPAVGRRGRGVRLDMQLRVHYSPASQYGRRLGIGPRPGSRGP